MFLGTAGGGGERPTKHLLQSQRLYVAASWIHWPQRGYPVNTLVSIYIPSSCEKYKDDRKGASQGLAPHGFRGQRIQHHA